MLFGFVLTGTVEVKSPIRRKSEQGYVVRRLKRKNRIKLRN